MAKSKIATPFQIIVTLNSKFTREQANVLVTNMLLSLEGTKSAPLDAALEVLEMEGCTHKVADCLSDYHMGEALKVLEQAVTTSWLDTTVQSADRMSSMFEGLVMADSEDGWYFTKEGHRILVEWVKSSLIKGYVLECAAPYTEDTKPKSKAVQIEEQLKALHEITKSLHALGCHVVADITHPVMKPKAKKPAAKVAK